MEETTQGKVDSTLKRITQMVRLYSTISMALQSLDRRILKVESTPTRRCTCLTTIECMRQARPTTIQVSKVSQLPTSRSKTQRRGNKFHNLLRVARSGMLRNDQQQVELEMQQRRIRSSLNSTRPFLTVAHLWPIQGHKSSLLSASKHKSSRGTSNYELYNQQRSTNLTVALASW